MSTQSTKSPTQEDLPKEEETKQKPENPQEQSKEEAREDTKVATSSAAAEKESSPTNATMIPLQEQSKEEAREDNKVAISLPSNATMSPLEEAALILLGVSGILSASDDEKEDNKHSKKPRPLPLKNLSMPSKRPFNDTDKDEDESQGKEKKKKEEPQNKKPKEVKPLEPYLVRLSSDVETEISFLKGCLNYHSMNEVYPFEDSLSLQDFMTNWLEADVLEGDLVLEIEKLKKKYMEIAEKVGINLNVLEPRNLVAFNLAHRIWSTPEKEIVLDVEPLRVFKMEKKTHGDGENSGKDEKEMSILEAETTFMNGLVLYNFKNARYPFDNDNDMDDFIKNWVLIDYPAGKFMQMIQRLRRKYEMKGKMRKNVGILGPHDRDAFNLAKKIWGNNIGN